MPASEPAVIVDRCQPVSTSVRLGEEHNGASLSSRHVQIRQHLSSHSVFQEIQAIQEIQYPYLTRIGRTDGILDLSLSSDRLLKHSAFPACRLVLNTRRYNELFHSLSTRNRSFTNNIHCVQVAVATRARPATQTRSLTTPSQA